MTILLSKTIDRHGDKFLLSEWFLFIEFKLVFFLTIDQPYRRQGLELEVSVLLVEQGNMGMCKLAAWRMPT